MWLINLLKKILLTSDKLNSSNFQVAEIQSALKEANDNDFISNKELANLIKKHGGVYLAIIGGTAALETTWIDQIEDVDLDDLNPESLWKFKINQFGPLLVAMDSHGGSIYQDVKADVAINKATVLKSLGIV
ncbi:MAG: hypothetical protein RLZZ586_1566 [Pseudomonadota bacterium]